MQSTTQNKSEAPAPIDQLVTPPKADKPKADKPKADKPKADKPQEGAGGKGGIHPEKSHAQRVKDFQSDTASLVTVLQAMGANVRTQASKNGIFVYRVYADLVALRASRDKAGDDKPLAKAAIAAFESVAGFRSGDRWVSATLYAESAYFGIKRKPGDHHPGAK